MQVRAWEAARVWAPEAEEEAGWVEEVWAPMVSAYALSVEKGHLTRGERRASSRSALSAERQWSGHNNELLHEHSHFKRKRRNGQDNGGG